MGHGFVAGMSGPPANLCLDDRPTVTERFSSSEGSSSGKVAESGSLKTVVASWKETACLRRLVAAFPGSNSKIGRGEGASLMATLYRVLHSERRQECQGATDG
jgi:hypothetical protein